MYISDLIDSSHWSNTTDSMLENASNGRLEFAVQAHTLVGLQCTITQQAAHTFAVQAHTFVICLPMCLCISFF